jgi:hypothetical protein
MSRCQAKLSYAFRYKSFNFYGFIIGDFEELLT